MKNYVIIGNGVAAIGCIEGIRSVDKDGKITVVSAEDHHVYCRPLISYYLENKTDLDRIKYRSADFYEKMNCDVIYGKSAVKLDTDSKTVKLNDGTELPYTDVCIATGSSPFVPAFEGIETVDSKFSFMTLDDALALEKAVNINSKVLIIGAGLIGLKCAEGLKDRAAEITVCDLADRVLSSILDKDASETVKSYLEKNGIKLMLSNSVKSFNKNTAVMANGEIVNFDVLVTAVGVRAETKLAKDTGAETDRGIIVDDSMKTGVENIYAAGDCTQGTDISCCQKRVLALLPNAYLQGECAGKNMAGEEKYFNKAIPMNSIGFFGLHIMTAGSYFTEADGAEIYEKKTENSYKKLFIKDGVLTGFIIVGSTERVGIYTSLIREKTPLDTVNFDLLKETATSVAFSAEKRKSMFGCEV